MTSKIEVLKMKQTRGAFWALGKQLGFKNGLVTIFNTLYRSKVKGQNTGQAFFSSYWDTIDKREAIVCDNQRITFGEFKNRTFRLANAFSTLGIKEKERVAELLPNCPEWFEVMFATALTGRSMPMLNWHLKPHELAACINKSEATALVLDESYVDAVQSVKDQFTTVKHIIVLGDKAPEGMLSYEKLIRESDAFDPAGGFGMSATPYSGGTTGTPKFLNTNEMTDILNHESDEARRGTSKDEITGLALMQLGAFYWYELGECRDPISNNVRTLIPGPLYHAGVQVAVLPFFLGGTAVPMRRFDPENFLKLIQNERINWTFVAPTMLERVLALPEDVKSRYNLGSMHSIVCAAAPCPPDVKKAINDLFRRQGAQTDVFMEYYGASETGIISVLVPQDYQADPNRYNSVGKIRAAECRIYDPEKKTWAPAGQEGKVLIRSHMAMGLQYKGDSKKTEEAFLQVEGRTWYDDGLIGYVDQDDFLYLTSRAKEMIISGGVNVFPNEIEEVIKKHPAVFDAAVVRAPDADLGEVAAAFIQLQAGQKNLSLDEVVAFCKEQGLYGFKLPRQVHFEKELPRQLSGKLIKRDLEEKLWQGVKAHG